MKKILLLLLAFGLAIHIQAQDLMDGLISVWELDESAIYVHDYYGTNNGTGYNNVESNHPGILFTACKFTWNTTDRIELGPGLFYGRSAVTISVWVKANELGETYTIISSWTSSDERAIQLRIQGNKVVFHTSTNNSSKGGVFSSSIGVGSWHHIVASYDGSLMQVYVNGVLDPHSEQQSGIIGIGSDQISCIGNSTEPGATVSWDGLIDQTAIWDRALTAQEVTLLYNSGSGLYHGNWPSTVGEPNEESDDPWLIEGNHIVSGTNGNVGIGTSSPGGLLEISGPNDGKPQLIINTTQSNGELQFSDSGAVKGFVWFNKATDHMAFGRGSIDNSLFINPSGQISMGTTSVGTHRLAVEGTIGAREIVVETGTWSDFVFEPDYNLPTLKEVETYIGQNGHLPDIPSAEEVEEHGISLGEMDAMLLRKVEELMLYLIEQQKELKALKQENEDQAKEIHELERELNSQ